MLNPRAVELARRSGVEIVARATFGEAHGTAVRAIRSGRRILGSCAASVAGHSRVLRLVARADLGTTSRRNLLEALAGQDLLFGERDAARFDLVMSAKNVPDVLAFSGSLSNAVPEVEVLDGMGSASLVGLGIGADDSARSAAQVLAAAGIRSGFRFTTPHSVNFLVPAAQVAPALRVLHGSVFGMDPLTEVRSTPQPATQAAAG